MSKDKPEAKKKNKRFIPVRYIDINFNFSLKALIGFITLVGIALLASPLYSKHGTVSLTEFDKNTQDRVNREAEAWVSSDPVFIKAARITADANPKSVSQWQNLFLDNLNGYLRTATLNNRRQIPLKYESLLFWDYSCSVNVTRDSNFKAIAQQIILRDKQLPTAGAETTTIGGQSTTVDNFTSYGLSANCSDGSATIRAPIVLTYIAFLAFLVALLPFFPSAKKLRIKNNGKTLDPLKRPTEGVLLDAALRASRNSEHSFKTARFQLIIGCAIALFGVASFYYLSSENDSSSKLWDFEIPSRYSAGFDENKSIMLNRIVDQAIKNAESRSTRTQQTESDTIEDNELLSMAEKVRTLPKPQKKLLDDISLNKILKSIGVLLAIESIAFFLLRDYRRSLADVKSFERQAAIAYNNLAAYKLAEQHNDKGDLQEIVFAKLLADDMLIKLNDNETTAALRSADIDEGNPLMDFTSSIFEKIWGDKPAKTNTKTSGPKIKPKVKPASKAKPASSVKS